MNENLKLTFSHQHLQLIEMTTGLSPQFIMKRHRPSKWSIHEHIAHLVRYQQLFEERSLLILSPSTPNFQRYNAENDPLFSSGVKESTPHLLTAYQAHRSMLINFVGALPPEDLLKLGIHPKLGALPMKEWIRFFLLHENHHLYTIFWLVHEFSG